NTIKGAASLIGMKEISETAADLEQCLEAFDKEDCHISEAEENELLDMIVKLEAIIANLRLASVDFEEEADTLIEESFESLQSGEIKKDELFVNTEEEKADDDGFEDFDIDEEMIEIFALEAEDHLRNINENLELLENNANDREALLEIRRSSHTLKGSAGIVGMSRLSKLAHKVEDLLDFISENKIDSNEDIFQLLLAATDCISALIQNENLPEYEEQIVRTMKRCDEMFANLKASGSETAEAEKETKAAPVVEAVPVPENEQKQAQPAPASTRSVIRVSLEKLDDLVGLVGELVFSRSVFEQRLTELEQQIDELQLSTRRLQRSTGRLETDFDAGMPGSGPFYKGAPQTVPAINIFDGNVPTIGSLEFDTLEFDRYTGFHETTRELLETTSDTFAINSELDTVHSFLELLFDSQKRLIDELQDKLLSLRMVSFGTLSARLQRTVRVTAEEEEKRVELNIAGENLDVDTQILDSLVEPLLHLLRNAVAHGIEPPETRRLLGKEEKGKISLTVFSEGTHIIMTVSDDGRGISADSLKQKALSLNMIDEAEASSMTDEEALALMFLPGLTTADKISQVAGRGVGMNIVKTNINRRQGTISVGSELQQGTTFTIRLPMALAVTRTLLVDADGDKYAFPLKLVKHVSEIAPNNLERARKDKKIRLGDVSYTVSHLNELLGLPVAPKVDDRDVPLLLLDTITKPCALIVDRIVRPEEVVIKPLGRPLRDLPDLLGATVLGDGTVVPVLDLVHLLNEEKPAKRKFKKAPVPKVKQKLRVMIVDDSPSVRHVNTNLVKNNQWEPMVAKDGLEALDLLQNAGANLPDIVLTDVEMPEMDGYELLASLKQQDHFKDIPVVMITSRASDKHRRKAFDLGVSEYVTKPYEESKLVEIIKRLTR
ncbi:MAG: hybrid sensor histidine kinase/response regulator, partial [Acidobacteriota bacterium]|nr:hybrid sensor histidine kinase/response regulator [Acidobacteriota bacterium]